MDYPAKCFVMKLKAPSNVPFGNMISRTLTHASKLYGRDHVLGDSFIVYVRPCAALVDLAITFVFEM